MLRLVVLRLALCCVGCISQPVQRREELLRLTCEEVHVRKEGCRRACACELVGQWPDDGAVRKLGIDELTGHGKDEVGLEERTLLGEVGEGKALKADGCDGRLDAIAGKVDPLQEVRDFISANPQGDFENLRLVTLRERLA